MILPLLILILVSFVLDFLLPYKVYFNSLSIFRYYDSNIYYNYIYIYLYEFDNVSHCILEYAIFMEKK